VITSNFTSNLPNPVTVNQDVRLTGSNYEKLKRLSTGERILKDIAFRKADKSLICSDKT
jgi:hypothetical protein